MAKTTETAPPALAALMLYDGQCGFCNWNVRWILARDRRDRFRFAPQQSAIAEAVLARHGISTRGAAAANSVFLVLGYDSRGERLLQRSDAGVQVLRLLGGGWALLGQLLGMVPKSVRDKVYGVVARNRYRFAGRYESCPLPSAAARAKFLASVGPAWLVR